MCVDEANVGLKSGRAFEGDITEKLAKIRSTVNEVQPEHESPTTEPVQNKITSQLKAADLLDTLNLKTINEKTADMLHQASLSEHDQVLSPPSCDEDTFLLILIVGHVGHFQRRAEVRQFVKIEPHRGKKVRLAFMTARAYETSTDGKLRKESLEYNDIIQANYKEAYRNMTRKTLEVLKWTVTKCSHAKFMVKMDDDVVMVYQHIVDYAIGLEAQNATLVYAGRPHHQLIPNRKKKSPWYISHEDFKNETYPPFTSGFFVLLSGDAVRKMYHASFHVPRVYGVARQTFRTDDAYFGVLARYHDIKLTKASYVIYSWANVERAVEKDVCFLVKLIASHAGVHGNHGAFRGYSKIVKYLKQLENMTAAEVEACEKKKLVLPMSLKNDLEI
ncbi:lactosylceramide 1,3-N-acetyl-beta-D-glucosaminyltransferase-like [Lineus longissimus]|uniref:lactosylceramide 1,3-N-acetyl-beta-D-glucosaminyltransferase-like n=1 Tax=Lineus longissimus TaxID=88925 RepID=UPI00315DE22A